jgi:hypothetical protein
MRVADHSPVRAIRIARGNTGEFVCRHVVKLDALRSNVPWFVLLEGRR